MVSYGETKITYKLNAQGNQEKPSISEKTSYLSEWESSSYYQEMQAKKVRMSGQKNETCLRDRRLKADQVSTRPRSRLLSRYAGYGI